MSSEDRRQLILFRHARAEHPGGPDVTRPLTPGGRREAPQSGSWLHEQGYRPELVLCSITRRTCQSWELAAPLIGGSPEVRFDQRVYDAGALDLLCLAQELPDATRCVLLVGHNPALAELAVGLAKGQLPPGLAPEGLDGPIRFPPAAMAVLEFTGDWPGLRPGQARIAALHQPAGS